MCGADRQLDEYMGRKEGSSPRVRSRPGPRVHHVRERGIISACAEQTESAQANANPDEDHLRVCGADDLEQDTENSKVGSSPRVWSRLGERVADLEADGIISACAEQTLDVGSWKGWPRDHLRVCGADGFDSSKLGGDMGSSPRVRSRPPQTVVGSVGLGIISAWAEQTHSTPSTLLNHWDHLRVCGADQFGFGSHLVSAGSSPRVRSRQLVAEPFELAAGIISACAEQTDCLCGTRTGGWDHLRVCGADYTPTP